MDTTKVIEEKFRALSGRLGEATLRLWAAVEARALGHGGVSTVASAVGVSRTTIHTGLRELAMTPSEGQPVAARMGRVRAKGGGRKKLTAKDPTLLCDLDALVEPTTRGDPQSPLRWTCKSTPRLAKELVAQGHRVSQRTVCDLLAALDYSLQATRKTHAGGQPADRDAQFSHIAATAAHNTATFAVESIRRWWREMGQPLYPTARRLLITADCGGNNGYRVRLWKVELQQLADELGLLIQVCHLPPGTSKWNKIEHRMFCHITQNWRGRPLVSREVVINLIGNTTTTGTIRQASKSPTRNSRHSPLNAMSSMARGTTGSSLAVAAAEQLLFKLFLLAHLPSRTVICRIPTSTSFTRKRRHSTSRRPAQ